MLTWCLPFQLPTTTQHAPSRHRGQATASHKAEVHCREVVLTIPSLLGMPHRPLSWFPGPWRTPVHAHKARLPLPLKSTKPGDRRGMRLAALTVHKPVGIWHWWVQNFQRSNLRDVRSRPVKYSGSLLSREQTSHGFNSLENGYKPELDEKGCLTTQRAMTLFLSQG